MDKSSGCWKCCEKWRKKHIELKVKLVEQSHFITSLLQLDRENEKLKDELREMRELTQTLRADCRAYNNEVCAIMLQLDSYKQLSNSQSVTMTRLNQERDEACKARQEAQTSLESCQATLKQYKALIEQQQEKAKDQARSKTEEHRVSVLEKRLQLCTEQVKQARSEHKKAMGWFRSFVELLAHPESWTSSKLRLQVERLNRLLKAEGEDFQCSSHQLEAFLETCASLSQELTRDELVARIREMQVPDLLSPLPPTPEPDWLLEPDPVPIAPLSASPEMPPFIPWHMHRPSADPSDRVLEKMQSECPSKLVPAMPVCDVSPQLVPPVLSPKPVLSAAALDTASLVESLDSVSLLPDSEPLKQTCLSKPVLLSGSLMPLLPSPSSDVMLPAPPSPLLPAAPISDPVTLTQHSESARTASSLQPMRTSAVALSHHTSPVSTLKPRPVSAITLSEPEPSVSSLEQERESVIDCSEPAPPISLLEKVPASVTSLSHPAPPPSIEEPVSVIAVSQLAQSVSSSKPEQTSAIALSTPVLPASSMELEPVTRITSSETVQRASLQPVPTSSIDLLGPEQHGLAGAPLSASSLEEPASPVASLKLKPMLAIALEAAPPVSSLEQMREPVIAQSESPPPVSSPKLEPRLLVAQSEPPPPVSSPKLEPRLLVAQSEPAPHGSLLKQKPPSVIVMSESVPLACSLERKPASVIVLSEPAKLVSSLKPQQRSVIDLPEPTPPTSLKRERASVIALSEPVPSASFKPEPTSVSELEPQISLKPLSLFTTPEPAPSALSFVALSESPAPAPLLKRVISETTPVLAMASSSLDLVPPAPFPKPLVVIRPLRASPSVPPRLMQQSKQVLPQTVLEPVQPTSESRLPLPASEPAYKGLGSLASHSKSCHAVSITDNAGGPEQHMELVKDKPAGRAQQQLIEACNPLTHVAGQEKSTAQKVLQRPQGAARKRQSLSADQQLMRPQQTGCEKEQPQESKEVRVDHGAPTNKKPRISKQQLRELFSSSSEDEEVTEEESAYVAFLTSGDHAALCRAASGTLLAEETAHTAVSKLSWLAKQPEVRPRVVASFVRSVKRDELIHAALLYLNRCKANPVAAYCRGEQAPPLITKLETLLLEALALKPGGWAALLSSLRARLWSPRRPAQMLAHASYVRLLCAVCSQLKEHKVALVAAWDLLYSGQAPFLVASAVGAWPGLLSALPPGPLQKAVGYILLRSPVHTLNSTLQSQACKVLSELGPLPVFGGDVQTLVEELLGPLLPPHWPCRDICLTHHLALEQLCRRSPVDLLAWLLEERLGPHLESLLGQSNAACIVRLLGILWKHCPKAAIKLDTMLSKLESCISRGDPALKEAVVQALLLLPGIKESHWMGILTRWLQLQQ